jgi:hypothetical protein
MDEVNKERRGDERESVFFLECCDMVERRSPALPFLSVPCLSLSLFPCLSFVFLWKGKGRKV